MIDARKFSLAEYAGNHPAGAIGRALLLRASDIMRTGDALALVPPTATVMDAALAMTASHGGSAIVVGPKGELKGIFTDGDFRRVVVDGKGDVRDAGDRSPKGKRGTSRGEALSPLSSLSCQVLASPVSRFMTASPLFVREDAYAADLLKIFERKHIDDLPVCDAKGRVVGLVDIQDLPKMKVL